MKKMMFLGLLVGASTLLAADVTVTVDSIHQRWPWESKIDVDFTVTGDSTKSYDVVPSFYDGETKLTVPTGALAGDIWGVSAGSHRVTLDPSKLNLANQVLTRFSVKFETVAEMPLYMVVDLTKAKGEDGQVVYLTKSDLQTGDYGPVEENPVSGVTSFIWTGVTNNAEYATTKMVFRRVNPGTFTMGYGGARLGATKIYPAAANDYGNEATLTDPYYIAVFPVTQKQWVTLGMSNGSYYETDRDRRPVEQIGLKTTYWSLIRGSDAAADGFHWPQDGYAKSTGSFLGKLQDRIDLTCDLPTEAQWEYACRAGTTTIYNDGVARTIKNDAGFVSAQKEVLLLGRFSGNGGNDTTASIPPTEGGTAIVGSYAPNAWGLYDMHGNVFEPCLDWAYAATTNRYDHAVVNPAGPATGDEHLSKGGQHSYDITHATSGFRWGYSRGKQYGFRAIVYPKGVVPQVGEIYSAE